ncbi:MAG: substrate-binding domain-containing protein, partial [Proteobacteria bacterium]|nr:substrate-binding domain-containing protein [Pseudomonadota bacterium]
LPVVQRSIDVPPDSALGQVAFERAGYSAIAELLKRTKVERGQDMIISTDDYFTRGALMAFYQAGWHIPRDIQLVTMVNYGHVPVTGQLLTRIEMYPVRAGEAMAQVVLRNLEPNHRRRKPLAVCPRFVVGKTTRPVMGPATSVWNNPSRKVATSRRIPSARQNPNPS